MEDLSVQHFNLCCVDTGGSHVPTDEMSTSRDIHISGMVAAVCHGEVI